MTIATLLSFRPVRLLITGSAGFVGRALVRAAMVFTNADDLQVIACDVSGRAAPDTSQDRSRLQCRTLDVRDAAACAHTLQETMPTHVLHAAVVTAGPAAELRAVNVGGTEAMMAAAAACGSVQRFLLLSSSAVYGSPRGNLACDEDHPLDLTGTYAKTKREAEQMLLAWQQQTGISAVSARLGPCYGSDETPGPFRPGISLVGTLLASLRTGRTLRMGGVDYSRDWTDVSDASHALLSLLLAPRLAPRLRHSLYNVSGGVAISAMNLVQSFVGHGARVEWTEDADAEVRLSVEDGRKPLVIDRLYADTGCGPIWDWEQRIAAMLQNGDGHHQPGPQQRPR